MNKQLVYNKSTMDSFKNADGWDSNQLVPFIDQNTMSKQDVFNIANKCRGNYSPIFAGDNQYLPTNTQIGGDAGATIVSPELVDARTISSMSTQAPTSAATTYTTTTPSTTSLTQEQKHYLADALLFSVGFVILFKFFE